MSTEMRSTLVARRAITLGDGSRIPLAQYVTAWKALKRIDPQTWLNKCPDGLPGTAADALRQIRFGVHDRINKRIPRYGVGRKWCSDWQRTMLQSANQLNHKGLIIRWLPPDLLKRFGDRLCRGEF